jgi:formylglycine-generating enzyme required for sulfatase activity
VTWGRLVEHVCDAVSDDVPKIIGGGAKQTPELKVNLRGKSPVLIGLDPRPVAKTHKDKEEPPRAKVVKKDTPGKATGFEEEDEKEITNNIGTKLVRIPAGKFTMGSPKTEDGSEDERPQHQVTINKAFHMGIYPVTQVEYEKVMKINPSYFSAGGGGKDKIKGMDTSKFPVEMVSWEDATEFCANLSALPAEKKAGRKYRLPTEAEWEYACRAGTKTKYYSGDAEDDLKAVGWCEENSGDRPHTVGRKKPNKFGLFDMHGNVWQWCADRYPSGYRGKEAHALRGGSWFNLAGSCGAASVIKYRPKDRYHSHGFRIVGNAAGTR